MKKQSKNFSKDTDNGGSFVNPLTYPNFISNELFNKLESEAEEVPEIQGLKIKRKDSFGSDLVEDLDALRFVCSIYEDVREELSSLINDRVSDRVFIDDETKSCVERNIQKDLSFLDNVDMVPSSFILSISKKT